MKPKRPAALSSESWDTLFDFLDPNRRNKTGPNRDQDAEAKYVEIVRKLVMFFASRTCVEAEDLATETVLRVAAKCADVDGSSYADPTGYFYAVARNVHHEWLRDSARDSRAAEALKHQAPAAGPSWRSTDTSAEFRRCLDQCLGVLNRPARRLILAYYGQEKAAKIECHQRLARQLGKTVNALRIEVYRIKKVLQSCVFECTDSAAAAQAPGTS